MRIFFHTIFESCKDSKSASIAFWHEFYISVFILLLFTVFSALFLMKQKKTFFERLNSELCISKYVFLRDLAKVIHNNTIHRCIIFHTYVLHSKCSTQGCTSRLEYKGNDSANFFSLLHSLFNCFIFMCKTCDVHKSRSLVQNPTRQFSPTRNLHVYSSLLCHRIYYRIAKRKTWLLCNTQKFWRLRENHEKNKSHSEFANEVFYAGKWDVRRHLSTFVPV